MVAFLLSPLGKLIGVGALAFIIGGVSVGWATHAIDNGSYQKLVAQKATEDAARAAAAVKQMQVWATQMHDAAVVYTSTQATLNNQFDAIQTELHNVQIRRPLPALCRPDAERVHALQSAFAASRTAATGSGPSR